MSEIRNRPYNHPDSACHVDTVPGPDPDEEEEIEVRTTSSQPTGMPVPWRVWTDAATMLLEDMTTNDIVSGDDKKATFRDNITAVDPKPEIPGEDEYELDLLVTLELDLPTMKGTVITRTGRGTLHQEKGDTVVPTPLTTVAIVMETTPAPAVAK